MAALDKKSSEDAKGGEGEEGDCRTTPAFLMICFRAMPANTLTSRKRPGCPRPKANVEQRSAQTRAGVEDTFSGETHRPRGGGAPAPCVRPTGSQEHARAATPRENRGAVYRSTASSKDLAFPQCALLS